MPNRTAHGYAEEVCSPIYSTSIGLIIKGLDDIESGRIKVTQSQVADITNPQIAVEKPELATADAGESWTEKIFKRVKDFFEADPDSEF